MEKIEINGVQHKLIDIYVETDFDKEKPHAGDYVDYRIYTHGHLYTSGSGDCGQIERKKKEVLSNSAVKKCDVVWYKNMFYYKNNNGKP